MRRRTAFTRADLIAGIVVTVTLIGVSHSLVGEDAKVSTRTRESLLKARGIHSGLVLYAQGNRDYYPGLTHLGAIDTRKLESGDKVVGTDSQNGAEPVYRITMLIRGGYFKPDYVISPYDDKRKKTAAAVGKKATHDNFSFALLRIDDKSKRVSEWKATQNSRSPLITDRNLGKGAGKDARSVSKPDREGWIGTVVYGDNHAVYDTNPLTQSEYALAGEVRDDDLFADDKNTKGDVGADAAMVYQDAKTYVEQK